MSKANESNVVQQEKRNFASWSVVLFRSYKIFAVQQDAIFFLFQWIRNTRSYLVSVIIRFFSLNLKLIYTSEVFIKLKLHEPLYGECSFIFFEKRSDLIFFCPYSLLLKYRSAIKAWGSFTMQLHAVQNKTCLAIYSIYSACWTQKK